jgi:transcriptional regulator with XRE-family HTH domain
MDDAAQALDCSRTRIGHIETGRNTVSKSVLEHLLRLYGADENTAEMLEELRRAGSKRGWWSTYRLPDWLKGYIGFEADAVTVRDFSLELIPGLLQTEPYARLLYGLRPRLDPEEVDRHVAARLRRQERLTAPNPVMLSAVLSQAALSRTAGMGDVGLEQLRYLAARCTLPNVTIQIMPFDAGAHRRLAGSFTLLDFAPGVSAPIAYQVYAVGGHLVDERDSVQELSELHDELREQALGSDESFAMISELTQHKR